ncbi:4Fe-4S binding protein [Prolixibacteraceae bacterium Z1-6]|uniref:4Fe-4S binding protein n=1 Tax=Draconibacterium aestuarii TaxID=2998507 RepID=A0A9X3FBU5_9BACT|nr:4Fe-4S binding protein [Prolixibacteraceae bacterium Z1-6]
MKKNNMIRLLIPLVFWGVLCLGFSTKTFAASQNKDVFEEFTDDYKPGEKSDCTSCSASQSCDTGGGTTAPPWLKFGLLVLLASGGAVYLTKKFNWKIAALLLALVALGFIPKKETCTSDGCSSKKVLLSQAELPPENEQDEFQTLEETNNTDEFEEFSDSEELDEFSDTGNEFEEFSDNSINTNVETTNSIWANRNFTLSVLVLTLTLIAGFLVRFKTTRKLKIFMLLGTLIYLGFINGACPCMISSFQNVVLYLAGVEVKPVLLLWFLGLIPLTYFFGKVWCGWVCHLGALQEFIFRPGLLNVLQDRKSQVILRWIRIATLAILIAQILITRTNIFIHYDPFKVAFNLFSANTLGYALVVILLVSSILIYRPFCRAFCPVGLILGWISYIPGASKLSKNNSCVDCKSCSNSCKHNAMTYENKNCQLNHEDCILCGDCMDSCKFSSIEIKGIVK